MGQVHDVNGFEVEVDFGAGGKCPFSQTDQDAIEDAVIGWVRDNVTDLPADEDAYQSVQDRLEKHVENTAWGDTAEPYWWGRGDYGGYTIHISRGGERWRGEAGHK